MLNTANIRVHYIGKLIWTSQISQIANIQKFTTDHFTSIFFVCLNSFQRRNNSQREFQTHSSNTFLVESPGWIEVIIKDPSGVLLRMSLRFKHRYFPQNSLQTRITQSYQKLREILEVKHPAELILAHADLQMERFYHCTI